MPEYLYEAFIELQLQNELLGKLLEALYLSLPEPQQDNWESSYKMLIHDGQRGR